MLEELDLLFWPISDDFLCDESGLLDVERLMGWTMLQTNSKKRNKKYWITNKQTPNRNNSVIFPLFLICKNILTKLADILFYKKATTVVKKKHQDWQLVPWCQLKYLATFHTKLPAVIKLNLLSASVIQDVLKPWYQRTIQSSLLK